MLKLWKRKYKAVKKWRSKAWSIDPKVTNLTIIKEEPRIDSIDIEYFNLNFNLNFPRLLSNCPPYFEAVTDIEQFG